jgi:hypothetical protein
MNKYLIFLSIIISTYCLNAQEYGITANDKIAFSKYLLEKNNYIIQIPEADILKVLAEHNVSLTRYSEILKNGFAGLSLDLQPNELLLQEKFKKIQALKEEEKLKYLSTFSINLGLSAEKVNFLENKYEKDLRFRQDLLPIMQKISEKH